MSAKSKQNQPIIAPFAYVGEFVSDMEKSLFAGLSVAAAQKQINGGAGEENKHDAKD